MRSVASGPPRRKTAPTHMWTRPPSPPHTTRLWENCAHSPAGERPRFLSPSPRIRSESPICTSPSARSCNSASGRTNSSCGWRKANSQAEKPPSPLRHPPARLRAGNPLLRKPPLIQENHPALQEYLDAILVTADDDWLYTQDWLAGLWRPYERHPHDIHACRSPAFPHPGSPAPALYMAWSQELAGTGRDASHLHVFTGCGGVLYPPRALHSGAVLRERFMDLAPTADALWLWCMATVRGTRVRIVAERGPYIIPGRGDVRGNMPPLLVSRTGRSRGDRTTRNWQRSSSEALTLSCGKQKRPLKRGALKMPWRCSTFPRKSTQYHRRWRA